MGAVVGLDIELIDASAAVAGDDGKAAWHRDRSVGRIASTRRKGLASDVDATGETIERRQGTVECDGIIDGCGLFAIGDVYGEISVDRLIF